VDLVWGLFTTACYSSLTKGEITGACVKFTISKLLGYSIILGSVGVKVPQIIKIQRAQSAEGVSFAGYLLETIGFIVLVAYNISNSQPFALYGENATILVQNLILMYLMASYSSAVNATFFAGAAALVGFAAVLASGVISSGGMSLLATLTIPVFCSARIPQIRSNYTNRSTGNLAFVTCFLNVAGNIARVFTQLAEEAPFVALLGTSCALVLNAIIVAQFFLYWDNKAPAAAAAASTSDTAAAPAKAGNKKPVKAE